MFAMLIRKKQPDSDALKPRQPAPWVGKYPDVPPPESTLSIRYVAARWACGELYGEDMPRIAADLLEAGMAAPRAA